MRKYPIFILLHFIELDLLNGHLRSPHRHYFFSRFEVHENKNAPLQMGFENILKLVHFISVPSTTPVPTTTPTTDPTTIAKRLT